MTERHLRNAVLQAASRLGARLFRVNTGKGWVGAAIRHPNGTVVISDARPFRAGLTEGGADLIGWTADGRFLAIELKTGRMRTTLDQERFLAAVRSAGGLAGVARSVEEAEAIILDQVQSWADVPSTTIDQSRRV